MKTLRTTILGAALLVSFSQPSAGADGVLELNQAKALVGGVTASDTAGFPVTLDSAGSYQLTGNLDIGAAIGVQITADDVTLDLNGFVISGPGGTNSANDGVNSSGTNTSVKNGTIRSVQGDGVSCGVSCTVERVRIMSAGSNGIAAGGNAAIRNNLIVDASSIGIVCGRASLVTDNVVQNPGSIGLFLTAGRTGARSNVIENAGNDGIHARSSALLVNNISTQSTGNGIAAKNGSNVVSNVSSFNGERGIHFDSDHQGATQASMARGNTVYDNDGGVYVSNLARGVITDNSIHLNDRSPPDANISGNTISSGQNEVGGVIQ